MTRSKKSKNIANALIILGILITLLIMGYKTLANGIHIDNINIGKIDISGLYLKIDDKLILEVDKIDLSRLQNKQDSHKNAESSFTNEDIGDYIKYFLFVISYFERLSIMQVEFADGAKRSIYYDDKQYVINTPELQAMLMVESKIEV